MSGGILKRMKSTIDSILSTPKPAVKTDFLVKMNLAPMMGRRDAALDRLEQLLCGELIGMAEHRQEELLDLASEMQQEALRDTEAIIDMLSSPDTEARERAILSSLLKLGSRIEAIKNLYRSRRQLTDKSASELADSDDEGFMKDDLMISECEILIVRRIREQFERTAPRLTRYREYANKSFSRSNADRYNRAKLEYSAFFAQKTLS